MQKTIKIGDKDVTLDNSIVWAIIYRNQFGTDIVPSLMPAIAACFDVMSGLFNTGEDMTKEIDVSEILRKVDGDYFLEAISHISGVELVDIIHLTWALAKTADEKTPEPEKWAREIGDFPLDIIGPALFDLVIKGVVSSKNLRRLEILKRKLRPLNSTTSSSQQPKED